MATQTHRIATLERIYTYLDSGRTLTARTAANKFGVEPHSIRARISEANAIGARIKATPRLYRSRLISVYSA